MACLVSQRVRSLLKRARVHFDEALALLAPCASSAEHAAEADELEALTHLGIANVLEALGPANIPRAVALQEAAFNRALTMARRRGLGDLVLQIVEGRAEARVLRTTPEESAGDDAIMGEVDAVRADPLRGVASTRGHVVASTLTLVPTPSFRPVRREKRRAASRTRTATERRRLVRQCPAP